MLKTVYLFAYKTVCLIKYIFHFTHQLFLPKSNFTINKNEQLLTQLVRAPPFFKTFAEFCIFPIDQYIKLIEPTYF